MGEGPNDAGLSRQHIIEACEASLRRLRTDRIDLYQVHQWDGQTPLEETLRALDDLQRAGKVRYVGASNYSGWHLMKALAVSERDRLARFASQQIYYSLQGREAEYELVPIALDQGVGILVWSPLAGGLLSGKYRRDHKPGGESRQLTDWGEPPVRDQDKLYDTIEALVAIARGARRVGGPGGARLAAGPAGGQLGHHRRAHRAAARGQPEGRRPDADRRRSGRGWMRSARRRCSTPTGTRRRQRPTGWGRPTCRCSARICGADGPPALVMDQPPPGPDLAPAALLAPRACLAAAAGGGGAAHRRGAATAGRRARRAARGRAVPPADPARARRCGGRPADPRPRDRGGRGGGCELRVVPRPGGRLRHGGRPPAAGGGLGGVRPRPAGGAGLGCRGERTGGARRRRLAHHRAMALRQRRPPRHAARRAVSAGRPARRDTHLHFPARGGGTHRRVGRDRPARHRQPRLRGRRPARRPIAYCFDRMQPAPHAGDAVPGAAGAGLSDRVRGGRARHRARHARRGHGAGRRQDAARRRAAARQRGPARGARAAGGVAGGRRPAICTAPRATSGPTWRRGRR